MPVQNQNENILSESIGGSQNDLTSKSRGNSLSLSGSYKFNSITDEQKQPYREFFQKHNLSTSRDAEEYLNFAMKEANLESQDP